MDDLLAPELSCWFQQGIKWNNSSITSLPEITMKIIFLAFLYLILIYMKGNLWLSEKSKMNVKGIISELLHLMVWGPACPGCIRIHFFYVRVFKAPDHRTSTRE